MKPGGKSKIIMVMAIICTLIFVLTVFIGCGLIYLKHKKGDQIGK